MIPLYPICDLIRQKPENYPQNVLFMWGTDSFLNGFEGELLEDFYEDSRKILNNTT